MPVLRLEQLQVGMELADDVPDRNGQPLVRRGTVLSEKDLRRFKMWGVSEVEIVGSDDNEIKVAPLVIEPALLERYRPEVREIFQRANLEHPFMAQLFQESLIRYVRQRMGDKT
jgi:hypothetical protein